MMILCSICLMGIVCLRIGFKFVRNEGGIVVFLYGDFYGGVWLSVFFVEVVIDMNKIKVDKIGWKFIEGKKENIKLIVKDIFFK